MCRLKAFFSCDDFEFLCAVFSFMLAYLCRYCFHVFEEFEDCVAYDFLFFPEFWRDLNDRYVSYDVKAGFERLHFFGRKFAFKGFAQVHPNSPRPFCCLAGAMASRVLSTRSGEKSCCSTSKW